MDEVIKYLEQLGFTKYNAVEPDKLNQYNKAIYDPNRLYVYSNKVGIVSKIYRKYNITPIRLKILSFIGSNSTEYEMLYEFY